MFFVIKTYYPNHFLKYLDKVKDVEGVRIHFIDPKSEKVSLGRSPHGHKTSSDQFYRKAGKYIIDLSQVSLSKDEYLLVKASLFKMGGSVSVYNLTDPIGILTMRLRRDLNDSNILND